MEEQLVSFETAKLANEKGFFEWTQHRYNKKGLFNESKSWSISAPTQSLLQKWLREVHNLHIEILPFFQDSLFGYNVCVYKTQRERIEYELNEINNPIHCDYKTYEEALEEGLQEALKLI